MQRFLPFLTDDAVAFPSHLIPLPDVARQKDHPRAVAPGERQIDAQRRRDLAEKPIRHLDQNAGTIPGIRFAAAGPSMQQVDENLEAAFDDAVGPSTGDVHHEPDATRIVLERRVVESGRLRRIGGCSHGSGSYRRRRRRREIE